MRLNEKAINDVNETYENTKRAASRLDLRVAESLGGTSIFMGNWQICQIKDLTFMINELSDLREAIETATGLVC